MSDAERGYTMVRTFDAARELVWRAWTDPDAFSRWWGTAETRVEDVDLDVREGGRWHATMILDDGTRIDRSGEYIEVRQPERLVVSLTDGSVLDAFETFTVTFDERDGATVMTLRQTGGHLSDEQCEQTKIGTNSFLDGMEALVREQLKMRHDS